MKNTHVRVRFAETDLLRLDLLTGILSQHGFEGFQQDDSGLDAYLPITSANEETILPDLRNMGFEPISIGFEEEKNWNELWESSFQPVIIPGKAVVRAHFHPPVHDTGIELVITPKMSFGTGHHDTTVLMMEALFERELDQRSVLDFGTGTGILAILAEKLGASKVLAIDNDPWSIANTLENIEANHCQEVEVRLAETVPTDELFDIVLANINKNVILSHADKLPLLLRPKGWLIVSGLLESDLEDVWNALANGFLNGQSKAIRNGWLCMTFQSAK